MNRPRLSRFVIVFFLVSLLSSLATFVIAQGPSTNGNTTNNNRNRISPSQDGSTNGNNARTGTGTGTGTGPGRAPSSPSPSLTPQQDESTDTSANTPETKPNVPEPLSQSQPKPRGDEDSCSTGVCDAPNGRGRCISMGKSRTCSQFKDMWLPTNLRPYFANRFPRKNADLIPQFVNIANVSTFDNTFANREDFEINYDWMNKYQVEYMVAQVACSCPTQQWYQTWFCIDILQYFAQLGDPCSRGAAPKICASTLDDRINSLTRDTSNITTCEYVQTVQSSQIIAQQHLQMLRTHPWRDSSTNCTSGIANEEIPSGERKCGMFAYQACLRPDLCPSVSSSAISNFCERELSQSSSTQRGKLSDPLDKDPSNSGTFALIGMSALALLALMAGLGTLNNIRRRGAKLEEEKEIQRHQNDQEAAAEAQAKAKNKPAPWNGSLVASQANSSSSTNLLVPAPIAPSPMTYNANPMTPIMVANTGASLASGSYAASPLAQPAMAPEPILSTQTVTIAYTPRQGDELALAIGDLVDIFQQFDDGWARGRARSSGASGFFPLVCTQTQQVPSSGYQTRYQSMGRGGR